MRQTTLSEQLKDIEWRNYVWGLVEDHGLTYVDAWLLCGNFKIMKELPSVEDDLEHQANQNIPGIHHSLTLKRDLEIQRMIACQNFRGVVAGKPVDMVRRIEDPPYSSQEHIYVDANRFSIEIGNEPFLSTDEMPLQKHVKIKGK